MSKYYIYNGQFYSEEELMHWKYIKREKKNGRWVYYYDQSELDAAERRAKNAENKWVNDSVKSGFAKYELNEAEKKYAGLMTGRTKSQQQELDDARDKYAEAYKKAKTSEKKAEEAVKKYTGLKVKTFAARTISKGIVKIANLFSKPFSKKK